MSEKVIQTVSFVLALREDFPFNADIRRANRARRAVESGRMTMGHLAILFYLVTLLVGTAALAVSCLIYIKTRYRLLSRYILLLVSFTLFVISYWLVLSYANLNLGGLGFRSNLLLLLAVLVSFYLLMFSILFFAHTLVLEGRQRMRNVLAGAVTVASLVAGLLAFDIDVSRGTISQTRNVWFYISIGLFYLSVLYSILLKMIRMRKLAGERRKMVRSSLLLDILFFPGIVFDLYLYSRFAIFIFSPLFYCVFCAVFTVYIARRHLEQARSLASIVDSAVSAQMLDAAGVSPREREIIGLMLKGCNNKEMAERLFISPNTVKTHNRNIFQKLGVSSRFELAMKLQGMGSEP